MKWLIIFLLGLTWQMGSADHLNIYVSYKDTGLKEHIQHFNRFLKDNGIFAKYNIQPFVDHYPLHTTLYLSQFESYRIPGVIDAINKNTSDWHEFDISTNDIYITDNNYVMLDVDYHRQNSGLNPVLQLYSDKMVFALYQMRDTQAPIPDWAQNIPGKQRAYQRYGSPNVFFEFSPHFTIMAKQFNNKETAKAFHDEVQLLIKEYQQRYPENHITVTASRIGLGYANKNGQITKEIANFPLQKKVKPEQS